MPPKAISWLYHLIRPLIDLKLAWLGTRNYPSYFRDLLRYQRVERGLKIPLLDLNPKLCDKTSTTLVDYHYFYQQLWVFKNVLRKKPTQHLDIGSSFEISAYLATFLPTTFVDLRPIEVEVTNLTVIKADILSLPFQSNSVESLSSLHVIEHIGLGRYGDQLDPQGSSKACRELSRVLKSGGRLYLSVPIGWERVCFNAHRVFNPETILGYFDQLKLVEFSVVDDKGNFFEQVDYQNYQGLDYGCGMFLFEK